MIHRKWLALSYALVAVGLSIFIFTIHIHAQSVAQSYSSDTALDAGTLVKLKDGDGSKVEAVTQATSIKVYGDVVNASSVPVTLSSGTTGTQVYVASTGTYNVLVSNQNGTIHPGDFITVSSLDGVGMKAGESEILVVGKAVNGFDGKKGVINTTKLKDSNKNEITVAISRIPVALAIGRNPLLITTQPNLPRFLQKVSQSIASKPVSTPRVYLSLVVLFVSSLIAGSILYAGVRSSIISIGRNPLSKKSIVRGMIQVLLTSVIIFIIGLFAVYLLLKL